MQPPLNSVALNNSNNILASILSTSLHGVHHEKHGQTSHVTSRKGRTAEREVSTVIGIVVSQA